MPNALKRSVPCLPGTMGRLEPHSKKASKHDKRQRTANWVTRDYFNSRDDIFAESPMILADLPRPQTGPRDMAVNERQFM
jgi:hypothetical protein